jgi:hypothetical protein
MCDDTAKLICWYWWSQMEDEHKAHWVKWKDIMKAKREWGLRIRVLALSPTH